MYTGFSGLLSNLLITSPVGGIRTLTIHPLKVVPLPVGLPQESVMLGTGFEPVLDGV